MIFRQAIAGDAPRILEIIRQARERMRLRGSFQWQGEYPSPGDIARDIERGYGYVICGEWDSVIAYGAVLFDGEPAYGRIDGRWLTEGPYVVVHRLAVADGMTGRGVATRFMQDVEELARRRGIPSFRVDTNFDNEYMQRILARLGFTLCGQIMYEGDARLAYEKIL